MREIKFRGKREDCGDWVFGAFVPDATEPTHGDMVTWGFIRRYNKDLGKMETIEVDRETVGQFTGFHDVKNGNEIYEGDIDRYGYIVTYVDGSDSSDSGMNVGFYIQRDGFESWAQMEVGAAYEVIGNIHDQEEATQ